MISDIVIKFDHVTKMYKLFKNDKKRLLHTFFRNIKYKEKKAVDNVSFEIHRGEAVALLGKNGAGKSTILKMITGVAFPTSGNIIVNGRVSALLELTSGFDPEFSGRENIYLKGQLLGLRDNEIKELEQENLNFSKTSHTLAHKQKALEYKLNQLINQSAKNETWIHAAFTGS